MQDEPSVKLQRWLAANKFASIDRTRCGLVAGETALHVAAAQVSLLKGLVRCKGNRSP